MNQVLVGAFLAAAVTAVATAAVIPVLRRRDILDHPGHRTSHSTATPRGGGLAFVVALVAVVTPLDGWHDRSGVAIAAGTAAAWAVGAAEDLRGVRAVTRLALQLTVGAAAIGLLAGPFGAAVVVAAPLGAVWFAAAVNAVNFMDGINGISGAFAIVTGGYFAWLGHDTAVPALAAGGALLAGVGAGFLPFNFPRARVFMGDAGSYFLGGSAAVLSVAAALATDDLVVAGAPFAYYLVDTGGTIVARRRRGERLMAPHREHAYQRLVAVAGWSHARVTTVAAGAMTVAAIAGAAVHRYDGEPAVRVLGAVVVTGAAVAVPGLAAVVTRRRPDPAPR